MVLLAAIAMAYCGGEAQAGTCISNTAWNVKVKFDGEDPAWVEVCFDHNDNVTFAAESYCCSGQTKKVRCRAKKTIIKNAKVDCGYGIWVKITKVTIKGDTVRKGKGKAFGGRTFKILKGYKLDSCDVGCR